MTQKKKLIVGQELIFVPCDPVNGMREESETVVVAKSGLKKVTFKTKDGKLHQNNLSKVIKSVRTSFDFKEIVCKNKI